MLWFYTAVLTVATVYVVYDPTTVGLDPKHGLYALWIAVPLGTLIAWIASRPKKDRWTGALASFASFDFDAEPTEGEAPPKKAPAVLKQVTALPGDLAPILERVGDGAPVAFYEIHPKIAYVAVVASDLYAASDYTSIVMKLDAMAPQFEARPLVPTDPPPAQPIGFTKDKDFTERYVVEGMEPKRVRSFLSEPLRTELCDAPGTWVRAEGKTLSVTVYGEFNLKTAQALLDTADVFFAEYGADGGPSLLEPGGPKKKPKKKKAPPAIDPEESPA